MSAAAGPPVGAVSPADPGATPNPGAPTAGTGTTPPRGLLIDFGGVLTTSVFDAFDAFAVAEGLAPGSLSNLFRTDAEARQLLIDIEAGAIDTVAFGPPFAARAGLAPDRADGIVHRMFAALRPDEAMGRMVRAARAAGIRTGLVSNSWGDGMSYDTQLLTEAFDAVVLSHEERIRKPAPEIFLTGAARIGLEPSECVFVDDLPFNLPPAEELGMRTVRHRTAEETIPQLEALFGISLR